MTEEERLTLAQTVYADLCAVFDRHGWTCEKDTAGLKLTGKVNGAANTYTFAFRVDPGAFVVRLLILLPFPIPEEKSEEFTVLFSGLNSLLLNGCFFFDSRSRQGIFRMSNSYYGSTLGSEVFIQMLLRAGETVDAIASNLADFVAGKLDMEQLLSALAEG